MIAYREAAESDVLQLSVLFKTVYIQAYGIEGVSVEFSHFIEKQFHPDKVRTDIKAKGCKIYLATFKSNLIGVLQIEQNKLCPLNEINSAEINKLYILDRFHGKGVAHELMQLGEAYLKNNKENIVWLIAWKKNLRAIRFYEKENYKVIGKTPFHLEENTYMNVVMTKEL